jgi:hypothetical protein
MREFEEAPKELRDSVAEFWPIEEWDNAVSIAFLESNWDSFVVNDTTNMEHPCGTPLGRSDDGVLITAEISVGYFQINACNLPSGWDWHHLYNTRHNAGTAHMLWEGAGQSWRPWYHSAKKLGLL